MSSSNIEPSEVLVIDATIRSVTVLEDRAQVWRAVTLSAVPGASTVRIESVAPILSDRSVSATVSSASEVRVTDIRVRRQARANETGEQDEGSAVERLRQAEAERDLLLRRARTVSEQRSLVERITVQTVTDISTDVAWGAVAPDQWRDSLRELGTHERQLRDKALRLERRLEEAEEAVHDLGRQVQAEQRPDRRMSAVIEVDLMVADACEVDLEVGYIVPSACWRPSHRVQLVDDGDGSQRALFTTHACVWQNTGEDWRDVVLGFSTQRPSLGTEAPLLRDDVVVAREKPDRVTVVAREQEIRTTGEGIGRRDADGLPAVDDGGTAVTLGAPTPTSVPSDGRPYRVQVTDFVSDATSELVCLGERAQAVVRKVTLTNADSRPVLAGPVDLIADSGLVGRTSTLFVAPDERFAIGFGPDPALRVQRTTDAVEVKPGALSRQLTTEHTVTLMLSNIGGEERHLTVTERIPVSEVEQVKVRFDDAESTSGAAADDNGFVEWKVSVAGGGQKTLRLRYSVSRARDVEVTA